MKATASSTPPLKNRRPRICRVGIINGFASRDSLNRYTVTPLHRGAHAPSRANCGAPPQFFLIHFKKVRDWRGRQSQHARAPAHWRAGSALPGKTLPIRVASKSVMISPRAKPGSHAHARRSFAVVHQIFFGGFRLTFPLFRRALVHPVLATQRRMVGQRAIQLWVVRSVFRAVPVLASLAGSATSNANRKSQLANRKFSGACIGDCGAAAVAAGPSF